MRARSYVRDTVKVRIRSLSGFGNVARSASANYLGDALNSLSRAAWLIAATHGCVMRRSTEMA